MEKLTKEEVRKPDVFLATMGTAWKRVEQYRTLLVAALGGLIILGGGFSLYAWLNTKKEAKAQAAYYLAKKSLGKMEEQFIAKPKAATSPGKKSESTPPAKTKTGNIETDYGTAIADLEAVVKSNPGTRAAVLAAIDMSDILVEYKQVDRAVQNLSSALKNLPQNELLYGLGALKLGAAQQARGSCESAIQSWSKITESHALSFLHGESYLRQGLCYEALSQKQKAIELYQKVSTDFADTDAGKSAKKYLRLLKNENV